MESLTKTEGVLHLEGIGEVDHEARVDLLQDLLLRDHHRLPLPLLDPLLLQLLASIPTEQQGEETLSLTEESQRYTKRYE